MEAKFNPGDLVKIVATNEIVTIKDVRLGIDQLTFYYSVFNNGKIKRYKEDALIPYVDNEDEIIKKIREFNFSSAEAFQKYAYYRIFSESQDTNLFSYQGNKIIFNPFQYKPLLKFISIDSNQRLLIADEVGVGKTIESGIIIDEMIARGEVKPNDAIVIVCPSVLCRKWRAELKNKFLIDDFWIHDGKSLKYFLTNIKDTGKIQYKHSIISEQLFRNERYQQLLNECLQERGEPFIGLLIVDECHHYRNPKTNTHQFGSLLSLCSERIVMLSATPFNLRSDDLYNQLHMLDPIQFPEKELFNLLQKQIRNVNQSISLLNGAEETDCSLKEYLGELSEIALTNEFISTKFQSYLNKVNNNEELTIREKVEFGKILSEMNPIASSFTRTLKRDALEHRVTRESITFEVDYTPEEQIIYDEFLKISLERYKMMGISPAAFGLIINGLERIAASSIRALERNIRRFSKMHLDEFSEMLGEDIEPQYIEPMLEIMKNSYKGLLEKIIELNDVDSKYDEFVKLVKKIQEMNQNNKRIIVFSFFTETLKYLRRRLSNEGYKVSLMYGATPDEGNGKQKDEDGFPIFGRSEIMKSFEKGDFEIMLVSEVGGEGLDFQFCSALINYDLPYNPMRIEQRIGRIDRMGQKADKIFIGNMCIKNTIDETINRVLLSRISEASDLVGELEPIIAQEIVKMNEKLITNDFSIEEIKKREKEIELRIEKEKQTREEFDSKRYELVNDKGFREEFEDTIRKSRITPEESLLFTYSFLKNLNGCWMKKESSTSGKIHVTKDICEKISVYNKRNNFGKAGIELDNIVKNDGELLIEFDGNKAYENNDCVFFKPSGPWIHFIIDYIKAFDIDNQHNLFYGKIRQPEIPNIQKGDYWLFSYEMEFKGIINAKTYEYVLVKTDDSLDLCFSEEDKDKLFLNIENAKLTDSINLNSYDDAISIAENRIDIRKEELSTASIGRNTMKIQSRIKALQTLSSLRIKRLEDNLLVANRKDSERLKRAIENEKMKVADKIKVLEEKKKYVGTYSLDAVCYLQVI